MIGLTYEASDKQAYTYCLECGEDFECEGQFTCNENCCYIHTGETWECEECGNHITTKLTSCGICDNAITGYNWLDNDYPYEFISLRVWKKGETNGELYEFNGNEEWITNEAKDLVIRLFNSAVNSGLFYRVEIEEITKMENEEFEELYPDLETTRALMEWEEEEEYPVEEEEEDGDYEYRYEFIIVNYN